MNWHNLLTEIEKKITTDFKNCKNVHELNVIKNKLIGQNSELRKTFSSFTNEEKKNYSSSLNEIKNKVINAFEFHLKTIHQQTKAKISKQATPHYLFLQKKNEEFFTNIAAEEPQAFLPLGSSHPLGLIIDKIHTFFQNYNFQFHPSLEIDDVEFVFDRLNIPADHPSRQSSDTFYLDSHTVFRPHSTNMTAHLLSAYAKNKKPFFGYTIGNVYRNDTNDNSHSHKFMQLDVCMVAPDLSFANLKWILHKLAKFLLGEKITVRFRSNNFPFTEPSLEMDIHKEKNPPQTETSKEEWTEVLGAGIIKPDVLKKCGIQEPLVVLAFGMGIDRLAMIKYDINDIRLLYRNEIALKV